MLGLFLAVCWEERVGGVLGGVLEACWSLGLVAWRVWFCGYSIRSTGYGILDLNTEYCILHTDREMDHIEIIRRIDPVGRFAAMLLRMTKLDHKLFGQDSTAQHSTEP